jgi:hypothetical protein
MNEKLDIELTSVMAVIAWIFAFLEISLMQVIILFTLMCFDILTGIAKVYRLDKNTFSFSELKIGFYSKLFYLLVPIILALASKGTSFDNIGQWLSNFALSILILSEAYSVLGNIYSFKTKKTVKDIDGVSYLLLFIRRLIKKIIEDKT